MTQCAILSEIPHGERLANYCEGLVRKINYKNGGINTKLIWDASLSNKILSDNSLMIFGADVIHPTNVTYQHPSIAGKAR